MPTHLITLFKNDILLACLVLLLITFIVFPGIVRGEVLVPADILFTAPAFRSATPPGWAHPQNDLLSDQARCFYPWHVLASRELQRSGRVPLWNPYEMAGQPLVANMQSALFFPPNWLLRWFDAATVATIRGVALVWFAGLFAFLFARRLGASQPGALLGLLATSLAGPLIVWLGHPLGNVAAVLPFLLWAGEGLLHATSVG